MNRPDPIAYAERLYDAICGASFSSVSFLTFGNAVKDGVPLRNLPRIAAEPFMRIVGEMLELEEEAADGGVFDAEVSAIASRLATAPTTEDVRAAPPPASADGPVGMADQTMAAAAEADSPGKAAPNVQPEPSTTPDSAAASTDLGGPVPDASPAATGGPLERRRNGKRS
jgi:hypothetical protein